VYGIGNAIVDLHVRGSDADIKRLGLEKGAMLLVDESEQKKILTVVAKDEVHYSSGGAAANSIIAIAQLGGKAAYGCIVGQDERGDFYLEEMELLGIKVVNPQIPDQPTGTSVVIVTPDGERTMNTHLGATAGFSRANVNEDLLKSAEWLFVEGYLFTSPNGQEAIAHAIRTAHENGVKVALTFGDAFIPEVFRSPVNAAIDKADLLIANLSEAMAITLGTTEEEAFSMLTKNCPKVVMTLSERGAWISWDGKETRVPAFPADVVDATGAGDMFAGAFMYGLTHGQTPEKSAELGCFLAGKVVSQVGARLRADTSALAKEILS